MDPTTKKQRYLNGKIVRIKGNIIYIQLNGNGLNGNMFTYSLNIIHDKHKFKIYNNIKNDKIGAKNMKNNSDIFNKKQYRCLTENEVNNLNINDLIDFRFAGRNFEFKQGIVLKKYENRIKIKELNGTFNEICYYNKSKNRFCKYKTSHYSNNINTDVARMIDLNPILRHNNIGWVKGDILNEINNQYQVRYYLQNKETKKILKYKYFVHKNNNLEISKFDTKTKGMYDTKIFESNKSKSINNNITYHGIPYEFICPITYDIFVEPMKCLKSNKNYEKNDIIKHIKIMAMIH